MTTRIGFQGFAAGADVVLSSDGETGATDPGGWPVQAQSGTQQSARIVMRRSQLQVAPEGINFEVVLDGFDTPGPVSPQNPYDPQFHDIYYFWDFGDPGAVFTAPEHLPDAHKNANRGYGPLASHTYQRPGSYNPTCLVIEPSSGKTALASLRDEQGNPVSITVGDPDVLFAGDRTIFVSTDATFARAPAGARTVADGLSALQTQQSLQRNNPTHYYRIMFDRDVEHDFTHTNLIRTDSAYNNFWFCHSPGSGTPGVIRCDVNSNISFMEDFTLRGDGNAVVDGKIASAVFDGLNIDGLFDVRTAERGGTYSGTEVGGRTFWFSPGGFDCQYILFNNVQAKGFASLYAGSTDHVNGNDVRNLILNNTTIDGWANLAIFETGQGFTAATGCSFVQDLLALSGGPRDDKGHPNHGPWRIEKAGRCVMHSCDGFSRNGWFPNTRGIFTPQPFLRWNTKGDPRGKLNMQACALEGAGTIIESKPSNLPTDVTINNILIDKCAMATGAFALSILAFSNPGVTVRNCLVSQGGNRNNYGAFRVFPFVEINTSLDDADFLATPVQIYSNTFLNHVADAEDQDGDASTPIERLQTLVGQNLSNITIENNILHQPNIGTPDVDQGPLGTTPLWTTRYNGYFARRIMSNAFTLSAEVPGGATFTIPYTAFPRNRTQADFSPTDTPKYPHEMYQIPGAPLAATFAFGATEITVTNNSGGTLAAGTVVRVLLRAADGVTDLRTEYATQDDIVWTAVPQTGSPAIGGALSGLSALDDFYGYARPQYPSLGAFEMQV